jgi:PAS domain S-box-containing protein
MKLKQIISAITADAYWKERLISGFMVGGLLIGNGVEYVSGKVANDSPVVWIIDVIIGLLVIISSVTKYRKYTSVIFKFFLVYLNFNVIYAYGTSIEAHESGEMFYILFSYILFVLTAQGFDSRTEIVLFTLAEIAMFGIVLYQYWEYKPVMAEQMQLFTFAIVLGGNYLISTQRIRLTQAGGGSNVQFKTLSEKGRDAQLILNHQFQFVYVNPAAEILTGYRLQEVNKMHFKEVVAEGFAERTENALKSLAEQENLRLSVEYKLKNKANEEIWVESIFSSFKAVSGADKNLIFAETRDIKERKALEEEIQQQLRLEEMLIKHSNQFINVERTEIQQGIDVALSEFGKMLNAEGVLVYRLSGKLLDEFRSTNSWFAEEHKNLRQYFNPNITINQQLISFLRSSRSSKSSHGNFVAISELADIGVITSGEFTHQSFYVIPLQTGSAVNGLVVFVFDKAVHHAQTGFFGLIGNMIVNAFTRLGTEMRLHEAQLTNEFILRALPDWLYMVNKEGEFTGSNNYSTLPPYIPDHQLVGKTFNDLLPTETANLFISSLKDVVDSDLSSTFEFQDKTIHKGRFFKVIIAPFKANEYLIIIRDITDLKEAQSELETKARKLALSNKELEEFAYIVSHDMKQPIRTIISYLSLMKRKHGSLLNEEANEFLNFSIDGANKMSALISDILQYSKLEQQISFVTDASLDGIVKKVLGGLHDTITTKNAEVVCDSLPVVKGNETMLTELFQNLIENGIKYNLNEKKTVSVKVQDKEVEWQFSISDNGIGFDQQYAEQIFKIFKRLHNDEEFQGTGIGLSICHKVVEKHGGKIWAISEKGKGSTFHFTLPKEQMAA